MLTLTTGERDGGIITASSGNHGLGVAYALASVGARGTVYVPHGASEVKVAAIRRLGAAVVEHGRVMDETEAHARATADRAGLVYISPYNDEQVIAGQGTVSAEMLEQCEGAPLDAVYVAVGGGGLASGIGAVLRALSPGTRLIGVSPANDAAMAASVKAGRIVEPPTSPTLSDATAGGIEPGAITLPLCSELVDEWVLVTETQIRDALRQFIDTQHQLIEVRPPCHWPRPCSRRGRESARQSPWSPVVRTSHRRACATRCSPSAVQSCAMAEFIRPGGCGGTRPAGVDPDDGSDVPARPGSAASPTGRPRRWERNRQAGLPSRTSSRPA